MNWITKEIDDEHLIHQGKNATLYRLGPYKFWHPNKMVTNLFDATVITFHDNWEFRDADTKKIIPTEKIIKANGGSAIKHVPDKIEPVEVEVDASLLHG